MRRDNNDRKGTPAWTMKGNKFGLRLIQLSRLKQLSLSSGARDALKNRIKSQNTHCCWRWVEVTGGYGKFLALLEIRFMCRSQPHLCIEALISICWGRNELDLRNGEVNSENYCRVLQASPANFFSETDSAMTRTCSEWLSDEIMCLGCYHSRKVEVNIVARNSQASKQAQDLLESIFITSFAHPPAQRLPTAPY